MGFIASSDHWSTHISYANLLVPDGVTTRADILDAFRQRRTYASTDNIVLDFFAGETMQGGELKASKSPAFQVRVRGTEPILRVEIIKNNRIVFTRPPDSSGDGRRRRVHLSRRGELRRHQHGADQPDPELGCPRNGHPSASTRQGSLLLCSRDSTL